MRNPGSGAGLADAAPGSVAVGPLAPRARG